MSVIKKVSNEKASRIITTREPLGLFYTVENDLFVAIDNLTGDAWTEEFRSRKKCFKYLNRIE